MQAIEQIRAALDTDVKGYGSLNHTWGTDEDDDGNFGLHIVGAKLDGVCYPVLQIDTAQYSMAHDAPKLADYYAACNPAAMTEVLAHIDALTAENNNLRTVMMAAAVEIQKHWDAHCDADGYGPANLMRRLESGYPEQYGYNAETVVRLEAENERLRKDAERKPMTDEQCDELLLSIGTTGKRQVWFTREEVKRAIDAAFHDIKEKP